MKKLWMTLIIGIVGHGLYAQINVLARTYRGDSIVVRWVPGETTLWQRCAEEGYTVQRFTLPPEGTGTRPVLDFQERIKLKEVSEWEKYGNSSPIFSMAAQAYWGEDFEMEKGGEGEESSQDSNRIPTRGIPTGYQKEKIKHSFALVAADLSAAVAEYSGLRFSDRKVKEHEDYIYLVTCENNNQTDSGYVFIRGRDPFPTDAIKDITAEIKGDMVEIKWKPEKYDSHYIGYEIYKSGDGKTYHSAFNQPIIPLKTSETKKVYSVSDSTKGQKTIFYKIRGISVFGDREAFSEPVKAREILEIPISPQITNHHETGDSVGFEFSFYGKSLKTLTLEGANGLKTSAGFTKKWDRNFPTQVRIPMPVRPTYFTLKTLYTDGQILASAPILIVPIDSLPPLPPEITSLKIDSGKVIIQWKNDPVEDFLGTRIFRSIGTEENFIELTSLPRKGTQYTDLLPFSHGETLYYQLVSEDFSHNRSLSDSTYILQIPDMTAPATPQITELRQEGETIRMSWNTAEISDGSLMLIYRQIANETRWKLIKVLSARSGMHIDEQIIQGQLHQYLLIVRNSYGVESEPSLPRAITPVVRVEGIRLQLFGSSDRKAKQIFLEWKNNFSNPGTYHLYRKEKNTDWQLLSEVVGRRYTDSEISPRKTYQYKVVFETKSGVKSDYSNEISIKY